MRRPAWSRRLVPMIIASVAAILSMEVAVPASADTNPAQPSLKELALGSPGAAPDGEGYGRMALVHRPHMDD